MYLQEDQRSYLVRALAYNIDTFRKNHTELTVSLNFIYSIDSENVVWFSIIEGVVTRRYKAGYLLDIGNYNLAQFESHVFAVLGVKPPEKKGLTMLDPEVLIKKAKEEGNFWGEVFVAICKDEVPQGLLWRLTSKLGKAIGFQDTDSNDAFKFAFVDVVESYKKANRPNVLLDKSQVDTSQMI